MNNKTERERWNAGIDSEVPVRADAAQSILHELASEALTEKRRARRWGIFFKLAMLALVAGVLAAWLYGSQLLAPPIGEHTAVIDLNGIIAADAAVNADDTIDALQDALSDGRTKAVLLNINSPGGSPVQSGIIFDEILRLRSRYPDIPIYSVLADVCASGGYYIASATDKIFADKASIVGSIGVRMDSFGFTEALDKLGVERRLLTAGENKAMLDPFLPEDESHKEHMQNMLDTIHRQFIDAVKKGRGERLADDERLFSGMFWSGEQALELGLVDQLANAREVARDVVGAENRVNFTRHEGLAEKLMGQISLSLKRVVLAFESGLIH